MRVGRAVDLDQKVRAAVKGQVIILGGLIALIRDRIDRDIQGIVVKIVFVRLGIQIQVSLVVHNIQLACIGSQHRLLGAPLAGIAVGIAADVVLAGIERHNAEVLLGRLDIRPERTAVGDIEHDVVPCTLEPLVLPGKDQAARISRIADRIDHIDQHRALRVFVDAALIIAHDAFMSHASRGRDTELGDKDRQRMNQLQILQIGGIGIDLSVLILILQIILLIIQAVGIIGIDMVGREQAGFEISAFDALGIHDRLILIVVGFVGMGKGIGRDPVGERQRRLEMKLFRFVLDQGVARPAQKGFKRRRALGIQILAVVFTQVGMLIVSVENQVWIPFDTDDPAGKPARYVGMVGTRRLTGAFGNDRVSVNHVADSDRVVLEIGHDLFILGIDVA